MKNVKRERPHESSSGRVLNQKETRVQTNLWGENTPQLKNPGKNLKGVQESYTNP